MVFFFLSLSHIFHGKNDEPTKKKDHLSFDKSDVIFYRNALSRDKKQHSEK